MAVADLYTQWLKIPPGPRPPDHYALLGIERFCDDPAVIEDAAHRQLDQLDSRVLSGDRARREACQQLMNEVARARNVLISPAAKSAYDMQLGRPPIQRTTHRPPARTPPRRIQESPNAAAAQVTGRPPRHNRSVEAARLRRALLATGAVVGALLIAVGFVLLRSLLLSAQTPASPTIGPDATATRLPSPVVPPAPSVAPPLQPTGPVTPPTSVPAPVASGGRGLPATSRVSSEFTDTGGGPNHPTPEAIAPSSRQAIPAFDARIPTVAQHTQWVTRIVGPGTRTRGFLQVDYPCVLWMDQQIPQLYNVETGATLALTWLTGGFGVMNHGKILFGMDKGVGLYDIANRASETIDDRPTSTLTLSDTIAAWIRRVPPEAYVCVYRLGSGEKTRVAMNMFGRGFFADGDRLVSFNGLYQYDAKSGRTKRGLLGQEWSAELANANGGAVVCLARSLTAPSTSGAALLVDATAGTVRRLSDPDLLVRGPPKTDGRSVIWQASRPNVHDSCICLYDLRTHQTSVLMKGAEFSTLKTAGVEPVSLRRGLAVWGWKQDGSPETFVYTFDGAEIVKQTEPMDDQAGPVTDGRIVAWPQADANGSYRICVALPPQAVVDRLNQIPPPAAAPNASTAPAPATQPVLVRDALRWSCAPVGAINDEPPPNLAMPPQMGIGFRRAFVNASYPYVVVTDAEGTRVYNVETGKTEDIPDRGGIPRVASGRILHTVWAGKLSLFDIAHHQTTTLADQAIGNMALSAETAFWWEGKTLMLHDLATGRRTQTPTETPPLNIRVDGRRIAWIERNKDVSSLYVFDGASGQRRRVPIDAPFQPTQLDLNRNTLVWIGTSTKVTPGTAPPKALFLYDLSKGTVQRMATQGLLGSVRTDGSAVVWTTREATAQLYGIYRYDLATHESRCLMQANGIVTTLDFSSGLASWRWKATLSASEYRVMAFDGREAVTLGEPTVEPSPVATDGLVVAWWGRRMVDGNVDSPQLWVALPPKSVLDRLKQQIPPAATAPAQDAQNDTAAKAEPGPPLSEPPSEPARHNEPASRRSIFDEP